MRAQALDWSIDRIINSHIKIPEVDDRHGVCGGVGVWVCEREREREALILNNEVTHI
jgi:hypothetical protein